MGTLERIQFIQFGVLSAEQIRLLSRAEITHSASKGGIDKDRNGTPYDERMGALENGKPCLTCLKTNQFCDGHFGHIVLPIPVFNKMFLETILKVLQCVCPKCCKCRMLPEHVEMQGFLKYKSFKRLKQLSDKCNKADSGKVKKARRCPQQYHGKACEEILPSFDYKDEIRCHYGDKSKARQFSASEALHIFLQIEDETLSLLGFNENLSKQKKYSDLKFFPEVNIQHIHQLRPESFIITVLPVIPPAARPFVIRDGETCDDDITDLYNTIAKLCNKIRDEMNDNGNSSRKRGEKKEFDRQKATSDLQSKIWTLMDNRGEKSKLSSGGRPHKCLFQRIGGKEGHVQSNIGGKRSDFTARSVIIGGGTDIAADEVGVPRFIAEELTKPVKVLKWNLKGCQKLVSEGKVNRVIRFDRVKNYDRVIRLKNLPEKADYTLEIGDRIERHLQNGDAVVVNRQPTLRQESMIALKVVIVDGLAIQLPLNVCQCLNADFDGDEINIHVPQSTQAIAEVEELLKMPKHIISPQNNSPIASVIQDGAVGVYMLTNTWIDGDRETMMSKDIFQDCVEKTNISLERYNDLLQRAHLVYHEGLSSLKQQYKEEEDPKKKIQYKEDVKQYKKFCTFVRYDEEHDTYICADEIPGKLMISILFPPVFCYTRKSEDNEIYPIVKIKHGIVEPTSGPLSKKECKHILHYLWKEHSTQHATMFLTEVQRLVYNWQPHHGFSMGPSDCLSTSKEEIAKALSEAQAKVADILATHGSEIDDRTEAEISRILNSVMNIGARVAKTSMNKGDRNSLNIMRMSGAKGSLVNLIQIIAFVGQQNLGGKRMPRTLSNGSRVLPHFLPNDNSPEARGFISNSFIDGLTPEQAFNHAASGREGVISTAVKTADSGYIQKRIGRKVEDLKVMMDGSVRDAAGNIVQFLYGDDGMDSKKLYGCNHLDFPFFVNVFSVAAKVNSTAIRSEEVTDEDKPRHLRSKEIELLLTYIKIGPPGVNTPVLDQVTENFRNVFRHLLPKVEIYECKIGDYFAEIKHLLISSKIEYGDMVGLVAASSIGEPTTQLSNLGSTRVIVREDNNHGRSVSEVKYGTIKEIIDKLLSKHDKEVIDLGNGSVVWEPTHSIYIMTVNTDNEKTEWKKLSEVSRHPTNGNLVRVKTKSKREVTTTLTHSHLSRTKEGKIVPKVAKDLKKGDFIPVNKRMNSKVLYKKTIIQGKDGIESTFPFDFKNGWLIGAYLAEGSINHETQLNITNISIHFEKRVKKFAERYEGKYSFRDYTGKILPDYPEYDARTHHISGIPHIVRFILKHCGTGSAKKNVPGFAYFAPLEFVSGLLRGYFDGDGNVNAERQLIRVHSISLNLLEQIALLLSRFGIFGTFGVEKKDRKNQLHNYILLRKHARLFLDNIGSDFPEKLSAIQEIVDYNERENVHSRREDIDRIPEMGEEIARVAKPLRLPGYSRNYGRWTRGKTSIGRETLAQYREVFDTQAEVLDQKIDLRLIDQAINSDVIWDEIVEIEIIDDPKELVYDFGVEGNHTFMIQNGIFVHNTLNFFHLAGVGGKDVSLGVPRLNELLNITKSDKQKKPSCTVYLDNPILKTKAQKVLKLEEKKKNFEEESAPYEKIEERIQKTKEDALMVIQDIKKMFEETTVDTFLTGYKMMYIPDDVCDGKGMNPIKIITYEEYEEKWWVSLAKDLGNVPSITPESWVVLLELDTEKLFTTKVTLEEIAIALENEADNQVACVPSPDVIGQIEVYFNFQSIKKYIKDKKNLPSDKEGLNEDNIDFFVCRDSIMSYIKKTHISGISRISKVYAREDPSTSEWILDTQGSNFLKILNIPGVDTTRTMSDDVWAINEVLGVMAARKFLIEELTRVISFDGTYINPRHIQLLVDRMTYTGDITSVRRDGISRETVGPIAKIMFEQQIGNGCMAAISTEVDLLKSVSSSVMYGTSASIGTAAVDVKDPDKIPIKPPGIPSDRIRTKYAGASKRSKIV